MIEVDKCKITHIPAPVLTQKAKPVENIDDVTTELIDKMYEIMTENKGMGLAGPQAGLNLQIFIISLDGSRENLKVYINPTVTPNGKLASHEEGCLSVPGIAAKIKRFKKCSVTATGIDGKQFSEEADGLYARCLQHEADHLDGITIANKMSTVAKIAHKRQLQKLQNQSQEQ